MVAVKAHEADRALTRLDPAWRRVLIYGPDAGLVMERAAKLASASVDDPDDAFQLDDYTIRFENDPVLATAPAQVVRLTQTLDSDLDARTFRVGDFGFGSVVIDVPDGRAFYQTRLDLREQYGV